MKMKEHHSVSAKGVKICNLKSILP